MPMGPTKLSTRMAPDQRRETLMLAAARLFSERGYAGTRLDDIAAHARVTKPIVYRHFESKKDLYIALLEQHREDLPSFFAHARDASPADPASEFAIRSTLEHWLDYVRENQHAWLMLFRDTSGDDDIQLLRAQTSVRAREIFGAFIAEHAGQRIPTDQVGPTAELLVSGLAGLALWWIDNPSVAKEVVVESAVRVAAPVFSG